MGHLLERTTTTLEVDVTSTTTPRSRAAPGIALAIRPARRSTMPRTGDDPAITGEPPEERVDRDRAAHLSRTGRGGPVTARNERSGNGGDVVPGKRGGTAVAPAVVLAVRTPTGVRRAQRARQTDRPDEEPLDGLPAAPPG